MADELNESAEFGRKRKNEEEPILVAQRFLNIYRQMHIFNEERRNQFDEMLLQVPSDIRILFSTLPGGSLLIEHIEELEKKHGLSSTPSKTIKPESHKRADKEEAKTNKSSATGTVVIDASFANELSSSLSLALQQTERRYKEDIKTLTETITKSIMESQSAIGNMIKDILLSAHTNIGNNYKPVEPATPIFAPTTTEQPHILSAKTTTETFNPLNESVEADEEPIITKQKIISNNETLKESPLPVTDEITKAQDTSVEQQPKSIDVTLSEEEIKSESADTTFLEHKDKSKKEASQESKTKSEASFTQESENESSSQVEDSNVASLEQAENSVVLPEKKKKKKKKNKNQTPQNDLASTPTALEISENLDIDTLPTNDEHIDTKDMIAPEEPELDMSFTDIDDNIFNDVSQENFDSEIINNDTKIDFDNYLSTSDDKQNDELLFNQEDIKEDDDFSFLDEISVSDEQQDNNDVESINQKSPYKNELSQIRQALEVDTMQEEDELSSNGLSDDIESNILPPDFAVEKNVDIKKETTRELPKESFASKSEQSKPTNQVADVEVAGAESLTIDTSNIPNENEIVSLDSIDDEPVSLDSIDDAPVSLDSIDDAPVSLDDINFDNQFSFSGESFENVGNTQEVIEDNSQQFFVPETPSVETNTQNTFTNLENEDWEWEYVEDDGSGGNDDWEWEYVEDDGSDEGDWEWEYVEDDNSTKK